MIYLRKISSLNNFKSNPLSGQIATILIIIMVAMIIFILATLNIGNVSFKTTKIANAADSTALYLASQIATKAHYIYHALGDRYHYCVKSGLLGAVLAFIVTVILVVLQQYEVIAWAWYAIAAAAAVAGAIGGAFTNNDPLKGAAMGAVQGFAIGAAFALVGPGIGEAVGSGLESAGIIEGTVTLSGSLASAASIGAMAVGALFTGAVMYNQSLNEKRGGENLATFSKQLSGLPQYESTREGVFLNAFYKVVDDPNNTDPNILNTCNAESITTSSGIVSTCAGIQGDPSDLDGDEKTDEKTSCFDYCWYNHVEDLKKTITSYEDLITNFFQDYLARFYESALSFLPQMDRSEIECSCGSGAESPMTALFRALDKCKYDLSDKSDFIWLPGPTSGCLFGYYDCPDDSCSGGNCYNADGTLKGWDEYDATHMHYENFIDYAKALLKPDGCGYYRYDANELSKALRNRYNGSASGSDWFDELFDNRTSTSYYDIFAGIADWMTKWEKSLTDIRDKLPGCQLAYNPGITTVYKQESATPYCADKYPPVYPCNWTLASKEFSGPYFPNPVCKVYPTDKAKLNTEIATVQNFIDHLRANIINAHFNIDAICPIGTTSVSITLLNVTQVCLNNHQMHLPCSKDDLNPNQKVDISYDYTYSYTCRECVPANCFSAPELHTIEFIPGFPIYWCTCAEPCCQSSLNKSTTPPTCNPCQSSGGCCSTIDKVYSGTQADRGDRQPIKAADLNIPCSSPADFLVKLGQFPNYIAPLSDTFATIYQDRGQPDILGVFQGNFQPVLERLQEEIDNIDEFLPGIQQLYNDLSSRPDNRATDGAGSVTYAWSDTEGEHSVKVESGKFQFPYTSKSKHGGWWRWLIGKTCVDLNIPAINEAWIEITRTDPGEKTLGNPPSGSVDLGLKWNPFQGPMVIKRKSTASYSATSVGIGSIEK